MMNFKGIIYQVSSFYNLIIIKSSSRPYHEDPGDTVSIDEISIIY